MNSVSIAPAEAVQPGNQTDLFDDLWRVFASPKLALFLMLGIAAACLVGALELVPVFETFWFRILLALLAANIGICTVNRLPGIWQAVFRPSLRPGEALFERGEPRQTVVLGAQSFEAMRPALRAALTRLHVVETHEPSGVYLYIDQNRFARFGTLISHSAMVLILAAAVLSGPLGYFEEPAPHANRIWLTYAGVFFRSRKPRHRLYAGVIFGSRKLRLAPQGCAPWTGTDRAHG